LLNERFKHTETTIVVFAEVDLDIIKQSNNLNDSRTWT